MIGMLVLVFFIVYGLYCLFVEQIGRYLRKELNIKENRFHLQPENYVCVECLIRKIHWLSLCSGEPCTVITHALDEESKKIIDRISLRIPHLIILPASNV